MRTLDRKRHVGESFKLDGLCIQARVYGLCRDRAVSQDIWHKDVAWWKAVKCNAVAQNWDAKQPPKVGDCGEDYESWPEKTGLQAVSGPVPVILLPQPGIRLIETRPAPQPRGSGFLLT